MIEVIYPVPEVFPDSRARFIQIINTCYALAKKGLNITLVTGIKSGYSMRDLYQFYDIESCETFKIINLPVLRREKAKYLKISWNGLFYLFFLKFLSNRAKKQKSLVFLRHVKLASFLLNFKRFFKIPMIFEVHEIFHLNTLNKKKQNKLKQTEIEVYKNMDALICISFKLKEFLIDNFKIDEKKISVVHDAVRNEWFETERNHENSYICYTGSLYKWKGVDVLISAMKYLQDEKLVIIGGGDRLNELKELAMEENIDNRVIFTGDIPHSLIPEYLSKAKIAVLPNLAEGPSEFSSPLKLFEYMAAGIPIVASDLPVFKEILQNNETTIFFEAGNPKSLADAIKKISDSKSLAEKLSYNAKKIAKHYTYEKRAEKILEICLKCLKC
ncbi:glycosyltransferase family 4 protein [Thermodesulfovibrio sp. 3907-1M]|uniref:Glycosyltransferase family 4 protein n=1 Tax=Thermodesulfovibrio autotrophicus TaxID=3118333 RepID=A0AAU8GX16_9BACT